MGQHKRNPTAIAAKEGKLPPKPPKKSKRQMEREIFAMADAWMLAKTGISPSLLSGAYGPNMHSVSRFAQEEPEDDA